jgi:hypothetical protein
MTLISVDNPTASSTRITIELQEYSIEEVLRVRRSFILRTGIGWLLFIAILAVLLLYNIQNLFLSIVPGVILFFLWLSVHDRYYVVSTPRKEIIVDSEKQTLEYACYRKGLIGRPQTYRQVVFEVPLSKIKNVYTESHIGKLRSYHDTIITYGRVWKETIHEIDYHLDQGWTADGIRDLTSTIREIVSVNRPAEIVTRIRRIHLPWPAFKNIIGKVFGALYKAGITLFFILYIGSYLVAICYVVIMLLFFVYEWIVETFLNP